MDAQSDSHRDGAAGGADKSAEPGKRCRSMVGVTVRAFVDLLQDASIDGKVTVEQIHRIAAAVQAAGGPLAAYYARTEAQCAAVFTLAEVERKRTDFLGRLLTHSFSAILDTEDGVDRKRLPQFFAAIRMVLGDETHSHLKARAAVIAEGHRGEDGLIRWDEFHADPESRQVHEQVMVTLARSFRRFEPRKDWFMILMNSNPSSVSLGSSVFVAKKPEEMSSQQFTEAHMVMLFDALLAEFRPAAFDAARRNLFVARWGADPEKTFGGLLSELAAMRRRLGM